MACPTIVDFEDFNAEADSEALNDAMQGMGTEEDPIIAIIANRSNVQRQELATKFAQMFGKKLVDTLKEELSGNFEDVVLQMFTKSEEYDAWCLHDALSGAGTTESTLVEIMCSRSNGEIENIKKVYKKLYGEELADALQGDTSGSFKHILFSLAQASRSEDDDVDEETAMIDAQDLLEAGVESWGTDESRFNVILASRSFCQLEVIMSKYEELSEKTLEEAIKGEMSGDIEDAMLAIVACAQHRQKFFAQSLYKSMKGLGTNDKALIRLMISRSEVDLGDVKVHFEALNDDGQTLDQFIEDDCSGHYKKVLLELCTGNHCE